MVPMDASHYQEKYWKELYQLRVHVNYLEIYMERSEYLDKGVNMFLAITSSSSICGWAIWNKFGFIWGLIIAVSQLINAIKYFLPYRNRMKSLNKIVRDLDELLVVYEMKWFDVSEGKLTEAEINNLQFEMRKKKLQSLSKHIGSNTLPVKNKYFLVAKDKANTYIKNFYSMEV